MLTTALNFLTDKRKRFHRSDTMPAFTNDSNFFKLTSDNQIIEIDKHSNVNKGINDHDNDDDNINTTNNSNNDGITFTNIHKRGIDHYEGEILLDKSISYRDELPSSSSRSCTHEKLFENNDADDDDDEGGGDGDDDNECNTSLVNFSSFTLNDKHSIENIKISCKEHLSVGNLDKYQFLDLETNLYRHGKNHLNSSLNENISRRLSHGYSLSNVQVPLDNTSIKSDVCSSVTFSRKAFNDIHHNSKDRKINDSSKCRKFESTKSLRFPPELKDSCTFISGDSNTEQTIDSTMKVSNKSKVAKMRARAVARVTKSKLKRSKSSAYMSKHFQELNSEDNNNNNNNIRNRSSSTHRNSDIHFKEQHLIDNKIHSNLMKNWIDKTPRIRSDISPQNITNTTNNTNNSNIYEITNMNEYFEELVSKANTYKFQIINAQDYSNPINKVTKTTNDTNDNDNNNNDNITMTTDNYIAKMLFSRNYNSTLHNNNTTYNKLNRYSVVKKLRRNNSSITYSNDQLTLLSNNNDHTMITTNSTAGDLLLPLTNNNNNNNDVMKNLIDQFFLIIKYNDYNQFFKLYNQYKKLSNKQLQQIHIATNQFGFTLLDCTQFNSSLLLYSYLLICQFLPGPYFQSILYCHPKYYSLYKFNKINQYLENLLDEKEIQLNKCKLDTNNTITLMNQLNIIDNNQNKYNNTNNNTNNNSNIINNTNISSNNITISNNNEQLNNTKIFAEISSKEKQLQLLIDEYDYLMKLIYNYNKLPNYTKSPHKVNIFLYSSNSILIRISPPKINKFNDNGNNKDDDYNDHDHDNELDHSSCDTTDNELNQDFINEGRKMNDINHISNDNLILRYCIEWSTCPKFSNINELYHCIVVPPIRMIKPNLNKIKQSQLNILRVGFYYLNNLPENKMIFIRVYAFSIKGWSEPCYSNPNGIILSSWIHNKLCEQYQTIIQHDNLHLSYTKYVDCSLNKQIDILKNDLFKQLSIWTNNLSIHSNTTYNTTYNNNNNPINMIDETNKRTRSPLLQRKRSFRFPFGNKGLKFVKQTKSGVYLALIYHTPIHSMDSSNKESNKLNYKSKILLTDDYIPIINISRDDYTNESIINSDFNWFSRLLSDSLIDIDLQLLYDNHITNTSLPTNLQLRVRLLEIIQRLKLLFNLSNLGIVYPEIIRTRLIDPNLINLKSIKNETFDLQDQIPTLKVSTEINDSINSNKNYDNHLKLTSTYLFILLKQINNPNDIILTNNLKWCNFDKFLKQNKIKLKNNFFQFNSNTEFINYSSIMINMTKNLLLPTIYSHLLTTRDNQIYILPESQLIINLDILLNYSEKHNNLLKPGLYIVLLQMKANIDQQATILISNTLSIIHMLPCEKIRTRSHVSYNEWYSLCKLIEKTNEKLENNFLNLNYTEKRFIIQFIKAIMKLSNRLCYPINHLKMFRIFLPEIIRISPIHSFIILLPPIDQVCLPPTSIILPSPLTPPTCSWISMTYFERNLGINYDPLFYNPIHYLISLLELLIPLSQFIQRQCLNELDLIQITERTQSLQMIQTNLENLYQSKRWLSDTISIGRDRKKMYNFHITIEQIINEYNEILKPYLMKSNIEVLTNETINFNVLLQNNESTGLNIEKMVKPRSSSVHSELFDTVAVSKLIDRSTLPCSPTEPKHIGKNSVIHVYADYPTGLNPGVSVRLLINMRTTVGEVIDTVVKQLLETADRKIFTTAENNDSPTALCSFDFTRNNVKHNLENHLFCLTVSVGQLERCLPNTVRLALLRRPWKFGKLTIRLLSDLPENIRHQITLNPVESKHSGLSNQIVSPLLTVTLVEPNLKQANINSPPEILH